VTLSVTNTYIGDVVQEKEVADLLGKAQADKESATAELQMALEQAAEASDAEVTCRTAELQAIITGQHRELQALHESMDRRCRADAMAGRALMRRCILAWQTNTSELSVARCGVGPDCSPYLHTGTSVHLPA
jgi:hypothetical protein